MGGFKGGDLVFGAPQGCGGEGGLSVSAPGTASMLGAVDSFEKRVELVDFSLKTSVTPRPLRGAAVALVLSPFLTKSLAALGSVRCVKKFWLLLTVGSLCASSGGGETACASDSVQEGPPHPGARTAEGLDRWPATLGKVLEPSKTPFFEEKPRPLTPWG